MPAHTEIEVGDSGWVSGTIKDKDDAALEPTTLVLFVYDDETKEQIATRSLTPATDAPVGVIGFRLLTTETVLVGSGTSETHVVRLEFTWNSAADASFGEARYTCTARPAIA
jgi:hypothetical protein